MVNPKKKEIVKEIKQKLKEAKSIILTDYRGLNVHDINDLRRALRSKEIEYKVFKNRLIKIAVDDVGLNELDDHLEGPTALAFGFENLATTAKVLVDFTKEHDYLEIKAGVLEGQVVDAAKIAQLAALPSREELLAMLVGSLRGTISGLLNVLSAPQQEIVGVLGAIKEQKT